MPRIRMCHARCLSPCDGKAEPDLGDQNPLVWLHLMVGSNILCSENILIFKMCNVLKGVGKGGNEALAHFTEEEAEAHRVGSIL